MGIRFRGCVRSLTLDKISRDSEGREKANKRSTPRLAKSTWGILIEHEVHARFSEGLLLMVMVWRSARHTPFAPPSAAPPGE